MRKKSKSFTNEQKLKNFENVEENLEEMPSELENQGDRQNQESDIEVEDVENQESVSEVEDGEIQESDSEAEYVENQDSDSEAEDVENQESDIEVEDGEIQESDIEYEDGEVHESESDLEDGQIRGDYYSLYPYNNSRYQNQSVINNRIFTKFSTKSNEIVPESNLTANENLIIENSFENQGELEEGEIGDDSSNIQVEEKHDDYDDEEMVVITEEHGYPSEFLIGDNYGYDDSILNMNLIGFRQSIINDENILEINSMVDRLKHDHSEEINNFQKKINELELLVQNLQVSIFFKFDF